MPGSIRRVATIIAASLFVGLNIGAATAQMKLNMPTRNEDRRTESGQACFKGRWLKCIRRAGADTFGTTNTFGHAQHIIVAIKHARRPEQERWFAFRKRIASEQSQSSYR